MDDSNYDLPQPQMMQMAIAQRKEIIEGNKVIHDGMVERAKKQYLWYLERGDEPDEIVEFLCELTGKSYPWVWVNILKGMPTYEERERKWREEHERRKLELAENADEDDEPRVPVKRRRWGSQCLPRRNKDA